jgi:fluoroquinolone transport system permease protein
MSRLRAVLRQDLRLQHRYRFNHAAAFVVLVWIAFLWQVPDELVGLALPFVLFTDLTVIGFYFLAGLVLFEKGERTLDALVVTPLRFGEYLAAKLATLTLLALGVSTVVVAARYGLDLNWLLLLLGVGLTSPLILLVGFILVAPYTSISSFLIPSQLFMLPLALPLIPFLGIWEHPLFYLFPTHGSLLLLRGAFVPIDPWQVLYATLYQVAWIGLLVRLARRAFERHVVGRGGRR